MCGIVCFFRTSAFLLHNSYNQKSLYELLQYHIKYLLRLIIPSFLVVDVCQSRLSIDRVKHPVEHYLCFLPYLRFHQQTHCINDACVLSTVYQEKVRYTSLLQVHLQIKIEPKNIFKSKRGIKISI